MINGKRNIIENLLIILACGYINAACAADTDQDLNIYIIHSKNELFRENAVNLNVKYNNDAYGVTYGIFESERSSVDLIAITGDVKAQFTGIPKTLKIDSNAFGMQFEHARNEWQFLSLFSVALSDYQAVTLLRDPINPTNDQTIIGDYEGAQSSLYLEIGYAIEGESFQVLPFASWYGSEYEQDGYREHGSKGGGTRQPSQEKRNNRFTLGIAFAQELDLREGKRMIFNQKISRSVEREKLAPNGTFNRQIPMAGFSFLTWTEGLQPSPSFPDRSTVIYEFGVSYQGQPNTGIGLTYTGLTNDNLKMDYWVASFGFSF